MSPTVPEVESRTETPATLYVALELSGKNWRLSMTASGTRFRSATVPVGSISEVLRAVAKAKEKLEVAPAAKVLSCYEAGRDGFWIHRELERAGVVNVVVDPSSIEVDRRQRRAKTDRLDAQKLVMQLMRHAEYGDRLRKVNVPSPEDEDARRLVREILRLKKERQSHVVRIKSLLALVGVRCKMTADFASVLDVLRQRNGEPLPPELLGELRREVQRLVLVRAQLRDLENSRIVKLKQGTSRAHQIALLLMRLKGIADNAAALLAFEHYGWRAFENGKQVGACAGLVGVPFASGAVTREQGITKAGNKRVRTMAIELAWAWIWYQPESALTRWYTARYANNGARQRRVGIVALARKLLVALWRYVDQGVIPEGAIMKAV